MKALNQQTKLAIIVASLVLLPTAANAQTLVNIPQFTGGGFDGYINAVYAMFISIAALLAVVKIIVAGVKYMFSDVVTQKSEAKKDIQGALLGLLIVLGAVLILTVINPNLTRFNLDGVTTLNRAPVNTVTTTTAGTTVDEIEQVIRDCGDGNTVINTTRDGTYIAVCNDADFILAIASNAVNIADDPGLTYRTTLEDDGYRQIPSGSTSDTTDTPVTADTVPEAATKTCERAGGDYVQPAFNDNGSGTFTVFYDCFRSPNQN